MCLPGRGPARERFEVAVIFDHDVARLAAPVALDEDVAGDQDAGAALAPALVRADEVLRRSARTLAERLGHRGLHEPVAKRRARAELDRRADVHATYDYADRHNSQVTL